MGCRIRHNREFGAEVSKWAYTSPFDLINVVCSYIIVKIITLAHLIVFFSTQVMLWFLCKSLL